MKSYTCKSCGKIMESEDKPRFCPFCGKAELASTAGRETALSTVREMRALIPKIQRSWEQYGKLHAEYERRLLTVNQYRHRGLVNEEEVPTLELRSLSSFLSDLREEAPSEANMHPAKPEKPESEQQPKASKRKGIKKV